jgi:hypothetical protein
MSESSKVKVMIPLSGKLRQGNVQPSQLSEGDFQTLINMRYTDVSIKSIRGMENVNTTELQEAS